MRISSRDNQIVKSLVKLHTPKRRRERSEYLVYGKTLCEEALRAGVVANLIFVHEEEYQASDFSQKLLVAPAVMRLLTENANVEICAVCRMASREFLPDVDVVVLDSIQDPGNLGAILRSARAFGLTNIFVSENCADLYSMKVLRAAQGAHLSLAIRFGDLDEYLRDSTNSLVTTFVDEPSDFRHESGKIYDIVFGNEGNGIRPSVKPLVRQNLKLDIDFESLNVAIAASIVLYTAFRKNQLPGS